MYCVCYSHNILLLFLLIRNGFAVINTENIRNIDQFKYCVRQAKNPNLRECIGRSALSFLQSVADQDNFTLSEGFVTAKDANIAARSLVNFLDTDPVDFRGIMENAGAVFSQRSMEFHMDALYPGLMFKIGPSADAKSVAEFVLDPSVNERNYGYDDPSTARVLAKQYLVPFLLGLKFNLVALVPLLFAFICLLLKKSLFLAKLAIYISSVLGIGGALGSLGSIGGFSGLGSIFGVGGFPGEFPGAHAHAHAHVAAQGLGSLGAGGYFPGKTTVYNTYDDDELHHNAPYKRTDRKMSSVMPRELFSTSTPASDHFYDYEKRVSSVHDRSGKLRTARSGKLGPSAAFANEADDEAIFAQNFMTSDRSGWKAIEGRT